MLNSFYFRMNLVQDVLVVPNDLHIGHVWIPASRSQKSKRLQLSLRNTILKFIRDNLISKSIEKNTIWEMSQSFRTPNRLVLDSANRLEFCSIKFWKQFQIFYFNFNKLKIQSSHSLSHSQSTGLLTRYSTPKSLCIKRRNKLISVRLFQLELYFLYEILF